MRSVVIAMNVSGFKNRSPSSAPPCSSMRAKASVTLSSPVSRTTRSPGVSAPSAASSVVRKLTRAGSVLVLNGHGGAYRAGARDVTSKLDKIRMRDDTIVNIHGTSIGRIASALLGDEEKIPRSVIK